MKFFFKINLIPVYESLHLKRTLHLDVFFSPYIVKHSNDFCGERTEKARVITKKRNFQ